MTSLRDLDALATVHPAKGLERKDPRITESLRGQERCRWCWAAVAQFALGWAKIPREQCDIASQHLASASGKNKPRCCVKGACDQMESLREVLKGLGCLDYRVKVSKDTHQNVLQNLRSEVLKRLSRRKPVAFRVQSNEYKHFIVCNGLIGDVMLLEDPCGPQYPCEFEASFLGDMLYNGEMDITYIYFLIKPKGIS